jgi:hypothetical protein
MTLTRTHHHISFRGIHLEVTEIPSDSEPEENSPNSDSEPEPQIARVAAHNDDTAIVPLICKPQDLWYLRYGHASTTALLKLYLIKSTFHSRKCAPCQENSQMFPSITVKSGCQIGMNTLGLWSRISSDNFQTLTIILPTISCSSTNVEITRWAHSNDLKDKSSATLNEKFTEYIAEVERQTGMRVKKLHVDGGGEYKGQVTLILKSLGIKYEPSANTAANT